MIYSKTYFKSHYKNAEDLYSDLNWLCQGYKIISIQDNCSSVTVCYEIN